VSATRVSLVARGVVLIFASGALWLSALLSCSEEPDSNANLKAAWYADALTKFSSRYPKVKIAIVWSERWQNGDESWSDLRVNSSEAALNAYRDGVRSAYYVGKEGFVAPSPNGHIEPPVNGCYVGAYPGWGEYEDDVRASGLQAFENLAGKSATVVPFSAYWGRNVVTSGQLDEVSRYGALPLLRLMPWGPPYEEGEYQPTYALQRIIDGDFDSYLRRWADTVKVYGKPLMMTFAVEMNGDWFPWSGVFQGGADTTGYGDPGRADGPERYVDAYRHVVDLFDGIGVVNVTWVWQPNNFSYPEEDWNAAAAYYPGDNYADWIGVSVYGALLPHDPWVSFDAVMAPAYDTLTAAFPQKPLMVAEWGVIER